PGWDKIETRRRYLYDGAMEGARYPSYQAKKHIDPDPVPLEVLDAGSRISRALEGDESIDESVRISAVSGAREDPPKSMQGASVMMMDAAMSPEIPVVAPERAGATEPSSLSVFSIDRLGWAWNAWLDGLIAALIHGFAGVARFRTSWSNRSRRSVTFSSMSYSLRGDPAKPAFRGTIAEMDLSKVDLIPVHDERLRKRDFQTERMPFGQPDPNAGISLATYAQNTVFGPVVAVFNSVQCGLKKSAVHIENGQVIYKPKSARSFEPEDQEQVPQGKFYCISFDRPRPGLHVIEFGDDGHPLAPPSFQSGVAGPLLLLDGQSQVHRMEFGAKPEHKCNQVNWPRTARMAMSAYGVRHGKIAYAALAKDPRVPGSQDPTIDEFVAFLREQGFTEAILAGSSGDVQAWGLDNPESLTRGLAKAGSNLEMSLGDPQRPDMPRRLGWAVLAVLRQDPSKVSFKPSDYPLLMHRLRHFPAPGVILPPAVTQYLEEGLDTFKQALQNPTASMRRAEFRTFLGQLAVLGLIGLPSEEMEVSIPAWGNLGMAEQEELFAALLQIHRTGVNPRAVSLVSPLAAGAPMQLALAPFRRFPERRRLPKAEVIAYARAHGLEGGIHTVTAGRGLAGRLRSELIHFCRILMKAWIMPGVDRLDLLGELRADAANDQHPLIYLLDHRVHQAVIAAEMGANILSGSGWSVAMVEAVHAANPDAVICAEITYSDNWESLVAAEVAKGVDAVILKPYSAWAARLDELQRKYPSLLIFAAQGLFESVAADALGLQPHLVAAVGFNAATVAGFEAQAARYDSARTAGFLMSGRIDPATIRDPLQITAWANLAVGEQEQRLRKLVAGLHAHSPDYAVMLLAPLTQGQPVRIQIIPREIPLDSSRPWNSIETFYNLQTQTIDNNLQGFFKLADDGKTFFQTITSRDGRDGPPVEHLLNLPMGAKPGAGKAMAVTCNLDFDYIKEKYANELW
ncbi:MAG TPA: hypothetical protein VMU17_05335, partial [Elusimicrobiota bacterium]|nr:hypothetical protein [Elusimicrobiota bacterium]